MGRPKLLLEVDGRTVIHRLVDALTAGGVTAVYVLVRADDRALQQALVATPAHVVLSESTADMRASVAVLLDVVRQHQSPAACDAWLLAPADHPLLDARVVAQLLAARPAGESEIVVPVHGGRRGHPTLFAWPLSDVVSEIPPEFGINWLLQRFASQTREWPVDSPDVLTDLDTPSDFDRLRARATGGEHPVCDEAGG